MEATSSVVLVLSGALDVSNRAAFKALGLEALDAGRTNVLVDFANCPIIDSYGLDSLVSLSKHASEAGAKVVIVNLSSELRTLFELTKFDMLFDLRAKGFPPMAREQRLEVPPGVWVKPEPPASASPQEIATERLVAVDERCQLLLVEELDANYEQIHQQLAAWGFDIKAVSTVNDARQGLLMSNPDIVLLGLDLPDGDGLEVAKLIKGKADANVRVIALTSRDDWDDKRRAVEAGVDDFIELTYSLRQIGVVLARNMAYQTR